uniref:HAD family hydrolase n=1 Tax=Eubacterium cellulosolvens TaxID=29322 RepID=UPI000487E288|nr:HAD family hydrolase [[Eubacterium] cellulosolvens]
MNNRIIKTDGIIFDVDGTMWDSTAIVADAWNDVLRKDFPEGVHIHHPGGGSDSPLLSADDLKKEFGKTLSDIIDDLLPALSDDKKAALMEKWYLAEDTVLAQNAPDAFPGLRDTLETLRSQQYPLYIVSNCQSGYIETFLAATALEEYFEDHLCPGDTNLLKGDNIRLIAEKHHLKNAVYIGDIQNDCNAAREAGRALSAADPEAKISFIWAAYGFGEVDAPDSVLMDIRELPELIRHTNH